MTPERNSTSRRAFLALAGLLPLGLAACSADGQAPAPAASLPAPDNGPYRFTVEHEFGTVTLQAPPQQVITLGLQESEGLLELGVAPRGRTDADITTWYNTLLNSMKLPGADLPQLVDASIGVPVDAIAKLQPDLIISFEKSLSRSDYDSLSKVAPVILPPKGVDLTDWAAALTFYGRLMGRTAIARQQIETTRAAVADSAADYPALKKATAMYIGASSVPGSDVTVFAADAAPNRFLTSLGLKLPASQRVAASMPAVRNRPSQPGNLLPRSRSKELTADFLVVVLPWTDYAQYTANGTVPGIPEFGTKNVLYVAGQDAFSIDRASALAMQWAARNTIPSIARVAYTSTTK
ncbi:ABC transporter substrate-binding protein [Arthrobacter sp. NPDC090010]|uniref:ABC transporter substrate-binding protein n=1 Tax=Arthrobacter sp. NPDC090010 TaxID=3363942 RepID=UPI003829991D